MQRTFRKELKMAEIEFKKISRYEVNIRHAANGGCIVQIGCCEASFTTPGEMLEALADFYKDPEGMEKKYNESNGPCDTGGAALREAIIAGRPTSAPRPTNVVERHHANRISAECDEEQCEAEPDEARIDHPGNN